jgi:hypothetical protein
VNENITVSDIDENQDLHIIDIDNIPKEREIYYSSIFKKGKTIILETSDECLIGAIDGIQVVDNLLFIIDRTITNTLFVFDKDGHFIRKIGTQGKGPGEYLQVADFTVDSLKKEIYLLDSFLRKINKYKIDTGEFLNSIVLDNENLESHHIQYHRGKLFLDAIPVSPEKNSFLLRDIDTESGAQMHAFLPADRYNCSWNYPMEKSGESFFYSRNYGSPKYIQLFMDTIVSIDNEKIFPFLAVKSKNWINHKDIEDIKKYMDEHNQTFPFDALQQKNKIHYVGSYVECKNFVLFEYIQGRDKYSVIYNTSEKTTKIANIFLDDLSLSEGFLLHVLACSDANGIYTYINLGSMPLFIEVAKANQLSAGLDKRKELMELSKDANPVIFYYECID